MITDNFEIRPRYNEVDRMGYVYHGNYVCFCHQARTELMRKIGICDAKLELNGIMMPVIDFKINYKKPNGYDQPVTIKTILNTIPDVRLKFKFEVYNSNNELTTLASSTLVFIDANTRKPMRAPEWIVSSFENALIDYTRSNEYN